MADPTIKGTYGLHPINLLGGHTFAGAIRHMPIAAGYNADIGYGDPVKRIADGTIQVCGASDKPIGVFVGCQYTNPTTGQPTFAQMWPQANAATDAVGFIVDDPSVLFKTVVIDNSGDIDGVQLTAVGKNASMKDIGTVNNSTGNSQGGLNSSTVATTNTLVMRIVDVVPESHYNDGNDKYSEVIVKINLHQYNEPTGV